MRCCRARRISPQRTRRTRPIPSDTSHPYRARWTWLPLDMPPINGSRSDDRHIDPGLDAVKINIIPEETPLARHPDTEAVRAEHLLYLLVVREPLRIRQHPEEVHVLDEADLPTFRQHG